MATVVPDVYRPGKRVGNVAVAHRAGAGDIISWSHANYTDSAPPEFRRPDAAKVRQAISPPSLSVEGHGSRAASGMDVSPVHGRGAHEGSGTLFRMRFPAPCVAVTLPQRSLHLLSLASECMKVILWLVLDSGGRKRPCGGS